MEYKKRETPVFSACGLNCGLCPRYHTSGASRCPGCAGEGFLSKHPTCGVLSCCQRKEIEYCYDCSIYPCKKYDDADLSDSFITHKNQLQDFEKAKAIGLEAYMVELNKKMEMLEYLLQFCDDGRRKSFFCVAVNLLDLKDITAALDKIKAISAPHSQKEKAEVTVGLFEAIAAERGISLRLRKKEKNISPKIQ